jgi:hypothetical protein
VSKRTENVYASIGKKHYVEETHTRWWACLKEIGHRRFIGETSEMIAVMGEDYWSFRLLGHYLTFESIAGSKYGDKQLGVIQYDLRTGHRTSLTRYWDETEIIPAPSPSSESSLVTNLQGDAAWILRVSSHIRPEMVDVVVHDISGTRTLASYAVSQSGTGPWVSPVSGLTISESTVSWRYGGEELSAPV